MKAMILAAGLGTRMGFLTEKTPKPLLMVNGKPLIIHLIEKIVAAGFSEIVINVHRFFEQFEECIGNGESWGISVIYSHETRLLGPAGGVKKALPFLGEEPFLVVSGDIWTDYPFSTLLRMRNTSHCVLVPNPIYHSGGDFGLTSDGSLTLETTCPYTYGNIGVFRKDFFQGLEDIREFFPLFRQAINRKEITGELYKRIWHNVGTPEELLALNAMEKRS